MKKGILLASGAYLFWGLFPIYWKILGNIPALQLLGHRIFWSFIFLGAILLITRQGIEFRSRLNGRIISIYVFAAILIAINWLVYVWAIGADYIVETSLGYFINPLISVLFGVIFLGEKLRPAQWVPIALAAIGVLYLTFAYGSLPWIALTLAFTFALYGLVKKTAPLNSFHGLTLETGLLFVPAAVLLLYYEIMGVGVFLHTSLLENMLLFFAGAVTSVPLLMFSSGARRIPLTSLGILQYMNPTMQFLLGVFVYQEPFNFQRLIGFLIVWVALVIYILEGFVFLRNRSKHENFSRGVQE